MDDNANNRKQDIIEAAKQVFAEQGVNKLTFRSVAKEADISPGTLYYYYNTKNEILYDILDSLTNKMLPFAEEIENGRWDNDYIGRRLLELLVTKVNDMETNKLFFHLLHESLSSDNELSKMLVNKYNSWLDSFEKVFQIYFQIPSPMSRALALIIDSMIDGLSIKQLLGIDFTKNPEVMILFQLLCEIRVDELFENVTEAH